MQAKRQGTSGRPAADGSAGSSSKSKTALRESAFSAQFLDRVCRREADPGPGEGLSDTPLARRARWSGPWEVEAVPSGDGVLWAVTRRGEPASDGGSARMACTRRQESLLGAAAFTALAVPNALALNTKKNGQGKRLGHPIHDGSRHIGHISPAVEGSEGELLSYLHMLRCLAADPEAAALFLAALDPETLAILGRAALRRLG